MRRDARDLEHPRQAGAILSHEAHRDSGAPHPAVAPVIVNPASTSTSSASFFALHRIGERIRLGGHAFERDRRRAMSTYIGSRS